MSKGRAPTDSWELRARAAAPLLSAIDAADLPAGLEAPGGVSRAQPQRLLGLAFDDGSTPGKRGVFDLCPRVGHVDIVPMEGMPRLAGGVDRPGAPPVAQGG